MELRSYSRQLTACDTVQWSSVFMLNTRNTASDPPVGPVHNAPLVFDFFPMQHVIKEQTIVERRKKCEILHLYCI